MSEIIKIQKVLHFKSVGRKKKTVTFCSNNVSKADVERVSKIRANKGSNKGDSTMMFGSKRATGYTALPNFGVNYYVALNTTAYKPADLPKVGEKFAIDVVVEVKEDGTEVPAKPVISDRTKKPLTNCFWGYLPS